MFETYTYDYILNQLFSNVHSDFDKRERSNIYDALAPAAAVLGKIGASIVADDFVNKAAYIIENSAVNSVIIF